MMQHYMWCPCAVHTLINCTWWSCIWQEVFSSEKARQPCLPGPSALLPNPLLSSPLSPQPEPVWGGCLGLAIERERHGRDSGELRRLLNSLECKQDAYTKSMILHSITRCVYLLESEVRERRQETPPHQPVLWGLPVPAPQPPD